MKPSAIACLLACSVSISTTIPASAEATLESRPSKTRLLELYTSEGCSSCSPAEAWLSSLKDNPRLWRDFAPIAFHVDYWDRLGWRDPYASKNWTVRQYKYAALWNNGTVYTPGFVLDGREWRNSGAPPPSNEKPGVLRISVGDSEMVVANFQPIAGKAGPLELHFVRLGFGLVSNVKAGENSGRKLEHDFVVLSLASEQMSDGTARLLPAEKSATTNARTAIVAWITQPGQIEPIQTVGGWLR